MMTQTDKQKEYRREANHRWNIKSGATRSGKTYGDYFMLPRRIRAGKGKEGLNVLLGNTKGTLQRNLIEPLQNIWGLGLVSDIKVDNTAVLFGEKCFCLGADKINQVNRIRGSSIKYCYGDEIVTWNEEVFNILKSRLDKPYSLFDGTCNPDSPNHWFKKKFLDKQNELDIYLQEYTIDDNPFLNTSVRESLKKEYAGTVYYDRFILGKWKAAEGAIYKLFADKPNKYLTKIKTAENGYARPYDFIQIGLDFGGNKSAHSIVASGLTYDHGPLTALASWKLNAKDVPPNRLYDWVEEFLAFVFGKYGAITRLYADSAEQTLINGLRNRLKIPVLNSIKNPIIDRIRCITGLIALNRFHYTEDCQTLKEALTDAVYNDKADHDERFDNGISDIDTLDAFEYSFENHLRGYAHYDSSPDKN